MDKYICKDRGEFVIIDNSKILTVKLLNIKNNEKFIISREKLEKRFKLIK